MISIIHPTRSRPEKSLSTIQKWIDISSKTQQIEIIYGLDVDDPFLEEYKKQKIKWNSFINRSLCIGRNTCAVQAINKAAEISNGNILIVVSDDTECFDDWDRVLVECVEGKTDWIMKCQDGTQPWLITMPVMDRAYYNRFGYIYHPSYRHMYCDTELTTVADMIGRKIVSTLMFFHNYHSISSADVKADSLKLRNDATYEEGRKNYIKRKEINFDLPAEFKMPDNVYTRMK